MVLLTENKKKKKNKKRIENETELPTKTITFFALNSFLFF